MLLELRTVNVTLPGAVHPAHQALDHVAARSSRLATSRNHGRVEIAIHGHAFRRSFRRNAHAASRLRREA